MTANQEAANLFRVSRDTPGVREPNLRTAHMRYGQPFIVDIVMDLVRARPELSSMKESLLWCEQLMFLDD